MKIFCDWIVKDEDEWIEDSLRSLLPYIDGAVVVDTGSTDNTLDIVKKVKAEFSNLLAIFHIDIGVHFDISRARNTGLRSCPPDYWLNEPAWYGNIAGDEIYDHTARNLRPLLERLISTRIRWVYTWGRDWHLNEAGNPFIKNPKFGRPIFYRHIDGMIWKGVWNRERIVYPDIGSYFPFESRDDRTYLFWDANVWYDHRGWMGRKVKERWDTYMRLEQWEKDGIIPHPE